MFVIRRAKISDLPTLLKLAKMVHFINLPADKDIISSKIIASRNSLLRVAGAADAPPARRVSRDAGLNESIEQSELFMFVLEDSDHPGGCLGTSQLIARMGGPDNPNVCFKLERREKFSRTLQVGTSNVVARVHLDDSSPTEVGGLILQPSFRGHPLKLGRFLSMVRFHFVGLHRKVFADHMLAEMMAPITPDGHNLLWDYLGRRFIPLSYTEADRFCQYSREFMTSLLPTGDIHLSLLPPEARSVISTVGPETEPARRLLEKLGFKYEDLVDPFDGGPYLQAPTASIPPVKSTRRARVAEPVSKARCTTRAIVSVLDKDGEFRAIEDMVLLEPKGVVRLHREAMKVLQVSSGARVGITPEPAEPKKRTTKRSAKARTRKPRTAKP